MEKCRVQSFPRRVFSPQRPQGASASPMAFAAAAAARGDRVTTAKLAAALLTTLLTLAAFACAGRQLRPLQSFSTKTASEQAPLARETAAPAAVGVLQVATETTETTVHVKSATEVKAERLAAAGGDATKAIDEPVTAAVVTAPAATTVHAKSATVMKAERLAALQAVAGGDAKSGSDATQKLNGIKVPSDDADTDADGPAGKGTSG